tara:strand:+ start:2108 stop:3406 length:1299 start_codon:yes stop_codon:yes gene_type:complete
VSYGTDKFGSELPLPIFKILLNEKKSMVDEFKIMENHVKYISIITEKEYKEVSNIGVLSGLSGIAIFQFHYADFFKSSFNAEIGAEIITRCIEKINNGYQEPSYCEGLSGFGWSVQYLSKNGLIEVDCDELLSPLDFYLNECMQNDLKNHNYDFLYGALGHSFYFLSRYLNTDNIELKKRYKLFVSNFVLALIEFAENNEVSLAWESKLNLTTGSVGYNLGLAHGIPSIIGFLTNILSTKEFDLPLDDLIKKGIQFMLSIKRDNNHEGISLFPDFVEKDGKPSFNSRLAWCYGDLGIGLTFLRAGRALVDSTIIQSGLEVLNSTLNRKKYNETLVVDGGLCHGSFGIAKIYEEIASQQGEKRFNEACEYWISDGLDKAIKYNGMYTYNSWNPMSQAWEKPLTLLEGISGIGLTMIDRLKGKQNNWHECLLIS